MDAQNLNITTADCTAESVAEDVKTADTPWMTKEEVQQKSDNELLQMIQQAQGHTGKDFTAHMGCEFSYSYLTGLLRDRGYENGWHKTSEGSSPVVKPTVIRMKKSDDGTTRKSYIIDEDVAAEWRIIAPDASHLSWKYNFQPQMCLSLYRGCFRTHDTRGAQRNSKKKCMSVLPAFTTRSDRVFFEAFFIVYTNRPIVYNVRQ